MNKDKTRQNILKFIGIFLLICIVFFSIYFYNIIKHKNKDIIKYNDWKYKISKQITDESEITKIMKENPYTKIKYQGYKIYAKKNNEYTPIIIYVEKNSEFYICYLIGSI
jgi:ABC-type bacteriocin/lantibiotic exporter with double-glycine peptidase domain